MNTRNMVPVLVAVLVIGTLGGITMGITESGAAVENGVSLIVDFDGEDPPPDPDAIPGGDPEHPQ